MRLLLDPLAELAVLFVLVTGAPGLCAAERGVIDPLVPERIICLLPPRSPLGGLGLSSSGELSGEQAVTDWNGSFGLLDEGRL